jgi:hypothetical protein
MNPLGSPTSPSSENQRLAAAKRFSCARALGSLARGAAIDAYSRSPMSAMSTMTRDVGDPF